MNEITVRTIMGLIPLMGGHGKQTITIDGETDVSVLLEQLFKKYGNKLKEAVLDSDMNVRRGISMYRNGVSILALEGLRTPLKHGDDFLIFPPVGGG